MAHADSLRINIAIASLHRITLMILDVSNSFQNRYVLIHEIVCVITLPYYLDWFEISYLNIPLNRNYGPFCLQCMNLIQGKIHMEDNVIDYFLQWSQSLSIRRAQLIMLSTTMFLLMAQCPILHSPVMMLAILLITRTHFLK